MINWYKNTWLGKQSPLVQLIVWIIIIVVLRRLYNWANKYFRTKGQIQELSDITTQISNLQAQGLKASYAYAQYSTWANQLQEAFDGCGTSNGVWRNVFASMKNDLDVAELIKAYGVRSFDECNWEGNFGDFKGSLSEALVHELSSSEIDEINKMLKSNNVKYQF